MNKPTSDSAVLTWSEAENVARLEGDSRGRAIGVIES